MFGYKNNIIPTISIFFKYKNDVDIFIEDSNDEEFYKSLFSKLLGDKRINKITSFDKKLAEFKKRCSLL